MAEKKRNEKRNYFDVAYYPIVVKPKETQAFLGFGEASLESVIARWGEGKVPVMQCAALPILCQLKEIYLKEIRLF